MSFTLNWCTFWRNSSYGWFLFAQNTRWHLRFARSQGISIHLVCRHVFASYLNSGFELSSLLFPTPSLWLHRSTVNHLHAWLEREPECPAGTSTCSWRSFPLRTGGHNLIISLSISPFPVEQDALFKPNCSGTLPTAHIWALCMQKNAKLCFFSTWSKSLDFH